MAVSDSGANDYVRRLIRPALRQQSAYAVPAVPEGAIKLDAMESPWPWPGEHLPALQTALSQASLNRYPDPTGAALKAALRRTQPIPEGAELVLGNGSDELIQLLDLVVAGPGGQVLAPEPSFSMYRIISGLCGCVFADVDLGPGFELDLEGTLDAIRRHDPALVYLAHPNNPTGNAFDPDAIEAVIRETDGLVVVDEAYSAYAAHSFLPRVLEFPNLVVLRTLSKVGLAGLRIGYLAAAPVWAAEFEKARLPYNLGTTAQVAGTVALSHWEALEAGVRKVLAERDRLAEALRARAGVAEVLPSETNFLTFRVGGTSAQAVHAGLQEAGVWIKCLDGSHPRLAGCLRVTVGTPAENNAFLAALPLD